MLPPAGAELKVALHIWEEHELYVAKICKRGVEGNMVGGPIIDAALVIAGNETCHRPQTSEHLATVEIMKLENITRLTQTVSN
ncbi:uncharacterized protein F5891DRAFT_1058796 [Suillus fuscotomentosus]|uniref:Uncharacterized protein n=1 Tax=Suillus fuscotomentosus TaxID=1912939 RepID=A0AAD4DXQ5_9AGAM|nr:uncharacterized protein F5891DRAFT_1058796 [Suillus fuscotomentosus]KAG1895486.1 hypothetical protein F5891DRAFT_1058796 [Suillus fuscotomentosus]